MGLRAGRSALRSLAIAIGLLAACRGASAHELRPMHLDVRATASESYEVTWMVPAYVALRSDVELRLPEECEPLGPAVRERSGEFVVERWPMRCAGGLGGRTIAVDGLSPALPDVLVRIEIDRGSAQIARLGPAERSVVVATGSRGTSEGAMLYLRLGIEHILSGVDHLLFVLGLLVIVRGRRLLLVETITAFTVAHSITLAAATLGLAHPPIEGVNALVAMSILFLGPEIIRAERGESSLANRWPWIAAFAFGLLHGFGFASGLVSLGLPRDEIPLALLMFNVGVEIGQLGFVAMLLALAWSMRVLEFRWSRGQRLIPAYIVGSLGALWTIDRVAACFS